MSQELKLTCPECGTRLSISQTTTTIEIAADKDIILKNFYKKKKAQERINVLRDAGIDTTALFAINLEDKDCIGIIENGQIVVLDDIEAYIVTHGTVPNRHLFRRWVMAQMFHMMTIKDYESNQLIGVTAAIHRMGYDYTWKTLENELKAQAKMAQHGDVENFIDRNRWFHAKIADTMAQHYITELQEFVKSKPTRRCKGMPYKTIGGTHIFVEDLDKKLYSTYTSLLRKIRKANAPEELYQAVKQFNRKRVKLPWDTPQCKAWIDAYKGVGAFYTLQNMIRFHNCFITDDAGKKLNRQQSESFIKAKAMQYCNGEGWKMLGLLKQCLEDNNINVNKKIAEWRNKK